MKEMFLITVEHAEMGCVSFLVNSYGRTAAENRVAKYLIDHFGLESLAEHFAVVNVVDGMHESAQRNKDMLLTLEPKATQMVFLDMM